MDIGDVKHVIELTSVNVGPCTICRAEPLRVEPGSLTSLAERVNHYIEAHGFRLLHVGQQSAWDRNGQQLQLTVAVLGVDRVTNTRNELAEEIAALREGFARKS